MRTAVKKIARLKHVFDRRMMKQRLNERSGGRKWNIENSSMDVYFDNCLSSEQNQYRWKIRGKGMLRREWK